LLLLGACTTGAALGGYSQAQIDLCVNSLTTPEGVSMTTELTQATTVLEANAEDTNYTNLIKICREKGIF